MLRCSLLLTALLVLTSCGDHSPTYPLADDLATISGKVTNKYGVVTAATVSLVTSEGVLATANTGGSGTYTIKRVRPTHYHVYVYLGRQMPELFHGEVDLHGGMNTFDIVTR